MDSLGIEVEEQFREAVTSQLRASAEIVAIQPQEQSAEPEMEITPMPATVVASDVPEEVFAAMEFMAKPWGLVLIAREPSITYIKGGISAATLGGLAALLRLGGIIAAALGTYVGVIGVVDQGKGVFMTWIWLPFLDFAYVLPYVTPIL